MRLCNRGVMMLLTTAGAFCAFSLMTIAVGTDYWLYSRGMCRSKSQNDNETVRKNEEVLTHSGLWRTCCTEGKEEKLRLSSVILRLINMKYDNSLLDHLAIGYMNILFTNLETGVPCFTKRNGALCILTHWKVAVPLTGTEL